MQKSDRHLMYSDVRIETDLNPVYSLGSRYRVDDRQVVRIMADAKFDSVEAARAFEGAVRELLENA